MRRWERGNAEGTSTSAAEPASPGAAHHRRSQSKIRLIVWCPLEGGCPAAVAAASNDSAIDINHARLRFTYAYHAIHASVKVVRARAHRRR